MFNSFRLEIPLARVDHIHKQQKVCRSHVQPRMDSEVPRSVCQGATENARIRRRASQSRMIRACAPSRCQSFSRSLWCVVAPDHKVERDYQRERDSYKYGGCNCVRAFVPGVYFSVVTR